jgi:phage baseplate assembly protein W
MAYKVQRISPLDLQPRKAVGVALPFSGRAVFNSTYTSKEAIRANLINYMLTGKNERVFNTNFGAGLRNLLFEAITEESIQELKLNITKNLELYFPRVKVSSFEINAIPDNNLVNLELKYSVVQTNIEDEISINFEQ